MTRTFKVRRYYRLHTISRETDDKEIRVKIKHIVFVVWTTLKQADKWKSLILKVTFLKFEELIVLGYTMTRTFKVYRSITLILIYMYMDSGTIYQLPPSKHYCPTHQPCIELNVKFWNSVKIKISKVERCLLSWVLCLGGDLLVRRHEISSFCT